MLANISSLGSSPISRSILGLATRLCYSARYLPRAMGCHRHARGLLLMSSWPVAVVNALAKMSLLAVSAKRTGVESQQFAFLCWLLGP